MTLSPVELLARRGAIVSKSTAADVLAIQQLKAKKKKHKEKQFDAVNDEALRGMPQEVSTRLARSVTGFSRKNELVAASYNGRRED